MVVLAGLVVGVSACGGSSTTANSAPIVFGVTGGNLMPFHVTIGTDGSVRASGRPVEKKQLSNATLRRLQRDARLKGLSSRNCPGTLPDVGSNFIRRNSRTVTVHGSCERRFQRIWNALAAAVDLRLG
jgi:hypothetical protein